MKTPPEGQSLLHGNERGTVLLFMLGSLLFLLVFGGFAIDLTFFSTAKGELQRSMDAASLAGAGQLSFGDSVFPTVRQEAQNFANLNPTRANLSDLNPTGAISLDLNTGNADPDGDITLGVWDGATFTPSTDGTQVNAVQCQYATDVPTSFLGILGFNTLPVSARAIATANPAGSPGPGCVFPIGLSSCPFESGGAFTSEGCVVLVTFKSTPITSTKTAAWANLEGPGTPGANYLNTTFEAMADNNCSASTLSVGQQLGTQNGMVQSAMNALEDAFVPNYNATLSEPDWITVTSTSGVETYKGPGWGGYSPVIQIDNCPADVINGDHTINGWARFIITQVINKKGKCAVANHYPGNEWDELCPPPNGTGENVPQNSGSFRAIFGYYDCGLSQAPPNPNPAAPRSSLSRRRRLVQ